MAISRDQFIRNFLDELHENLAAADNQILALKKTPDDAEELTKLLRTLHTIKGSARMLNFRTIEQVVHGLENVFKGVKDAQYSITPPLIQVVFITTDYLRAAAEAIEHGQRDDLPAERLLRVFEQAGAGEAYTLDHLREPLDAFRTRQAATATAGITGTPSAPGSAAQETIRIKLSKTEKMIKQLNNLIIKQFQLRRENDAISALQEKFQALMSTPLRHPDTNAPMPRPPEYAQQENECVKLLQQLKKDFALDLSMLEANTAELQQEIFSLRMLPLELVLGTLPKMVEETAMLLGKEVDFSMTGGDLMIDKIILESLHDPLIHLVRNAIDHGIEPPDERRQQGKPATGTLRLACYLESGSMMLSVRDDGRGLDYEKIRAKAVRQHPGQAEEIAAMDVSALHAFVFESGFSTRDTAQKLSGRGVGMDIVKHNIEAIKGRITLTSEPGQGTEFLLTLPLSLATVEGFFIRSAGEKFLIPSTFVQEVLIVKRAEHVHLGQKEAIRLREKIIPIYYLSSILDKDDNTAEQEKHFVLVVESVGNEIGIVVDAILQYDTLIYKPLPPSLSSLNLLQGIVFDESYNIINILFVPALMERFKSLRAPSKPATQAEAMVRARKTALVVDDSYSTREIERSILELEGYRVLMAGDGLEGLEMLKQEAVDVIITDIRMPRLDGLGFVERLRQDPNYARTPVIVVSTVDDPDIRRQFLDKGVNSFIIKADFERGNLMAEVNTLLGV